MSMTGHNKMTVVFVFFCPSAFFFWFFSSAHFSQRDDSVSRDCPVRIAITLRAYGVRFPAVGADFYLLYSVKIGPVGWSGRVLLVLPAQSFLVPGLAGPMTVFFCIISE
jgi:hypothetical protein